MVLRRKLVEKSKSSKMYNYIILLCAMVYTVAYIGRLNFTASIVDIIDQFDSTKEMVGLVGTFFFFSYGAGQLVNGIMAKYYNVKIMITISLMLSAIINLMMPYMNDVSSMKYLWALNGMAQSILWSSIIKILGEYLPAEYMNKAIIILSVTVPIGTTLAYSISAIASLIGMWQIVFYVACIVLSLTAAFWWIFTGKIFANISPIEKQVAVKPLHEIQVDNKTNTAKVKRNMGYIIIVVMVACVAGSFNNFSKDGIVTWVPSFLKDNYNMPSYFSILLTLLLPLVSVGGALISQGLYKIIRDYFTVGVVLFSVSAASIGIVTVFIDSSVAITISALCISSCVLAGINSIVTSALPLTLRGQIKPGLIAGIINSCCYFGSALSTYVLGAVQEQNGWNTMFFVLLSVSVLGGVVMCVGIITNVINNKMKKTLANKTQSN